MDDDDTSTNESTRLVFVNKIVTSSCATITTYLVKSTDSDLSD